ncbi:hypothetical protein ASE92_18250 [Pedobacter sp. Leaf41]|uniref:hypothetical protein n=1 Tax=Pedobacter sp. Leaf41 TaxID=1736218 RepID=UPI0007026BAA|nr:hypothetical protein [Pedobacter sp. Leaf41]KQN32538.1 hypothetical protein ASE92_18250 [Pedobacter sp. Leaf41]
MLLKKTGLLIIIFLCSQFSQAQSGCLISSNATVYTEQDNNGLVNAVLALVFGGNPVYKANPNEPSVATCVNNSHKVWTATSQNCTVCPFGYSFNLLNVITGCQTTTYQGKVASSQILFCPLDDYTLPLTATAGLFGIFFIRKRKLF